MSNNILLLIITSFAVYGNIEFPSLYLRAGILTLIFVIAIYDLSAFGWPQTVKSVDYLKRCLLVKLQLDFITMIRYHIT